MIGFPKPEKRRTTKRRLRRFEAVVKQDVRAFCVARDGYCRYAKTRLGECDGPSEWAHLGDKKRARTRNMPPHDRHTTSGSLMLCRTHHQRYDAGAIIILGDDANGPLEFYAKAAMKEML